jgi:CBS domain-containing protein
MEGKNMREPCVSDFMHKLQDMVPPDASLREAGERMAALGCGALCVGSEGELLGVITGRDIATRALAAGKDLRSEFVRDWMTKGVFVCREADTLPQAVEIMRRHGVSRLAVVDETNNLAGMLSAGMILRDAAGAEATIEVVTEDWFQRHDPEALRA